MRIAVFSDIHSNFEALQRVLKYLSEEKIEQYFCIGDVVGYGANPNECTALVKALNCIAVAGNHDYAVLGKTDIDSFNEAAQAAVQWTKKELLPHTSEFLEALPIENSLCDITLVHATHQNPLQWQYLLSEKQAQQDFAFLKGKIGFIGHSHIPRVFEYSEKKDTVSSYNDEAVQIKSDGYRYIINVGSIGQPRDGNPAACFVIFDTDKQQLDYCRLEYDYKLTQDKIRAARLPEILATRLAIGK